MVDDFDIDVAYDFKCDNQLPDELMEMMRKSGILRMRLKSDRSKKIIYPIIKDEWENNAAYRVWVTKLARDKFQEKYPLQHGS